MNSILQIPIAMDSSRKNASTMKRCLICRGSNMLSKLLSPKSLSSTRSLAEQKIINLKENWAKSCIDAVCTILKISKSHPFRQFFTNANYCQDCIQLLRDIDFTLKSAKTLQQQIIGFRQDLLVKLADNFEAVENKEDLSTVSYKEIESLTNGSKTTFQYDEVIKMMFEKLNVMQDSWTSVDFLEQKQLHLLNSVRRMQNSISERANTGPNSPNSEDKSAKEESIRLLRTKQKVNYTENADVIQQPEGIIIENDLETEGFDQEIDPDPDWNMSDDSEVVKDANAVTVKDLADKTTSNHKVGPTEKNSFSCSYEHCFKHFDKNEDLTVHELKVHKGDLKPYHCKFCDDKYRYASSLTEHLKRHKSNPSIAVDCPECGKTLMQCNLNLHIRKVHKKKLCGFCGKGFDNEAELLKHKNSHNNAQGPSNKNNLPSSDNDESCPVPEIEDFRVHEKEEVLADDSKPHLCTLCDQKFRYAATLAKHMGIKHRNRYVPVPVDCPECGKTIMQCRIKKHIRVVHRKRQKCCSFCGKEFENAEELLEHENLHKNSDQPFKCLTCDSTFTNTTKLKQHMRTHSKDGQICDVCGKRYRSHKSLQFHRKSHDESRIGHRCPECGRDCPSKGKLELHMMVHSNEKNFICDVCGTAFKYENGLKRHYRNHTGDFPFVCKLCGKRFSTSYYLATHEEIHSGILAYECKICKKKFTRKKNCMKHEKTHEPKDPNRKQLIQKKGKIFSPKNTNSPFGVRKKTNRLKSVAKARINANKRRKTKYSRSPTSDEDNNYD